MAKLNFDELPETDGVWMNKAGYWISIRDNKCHNSLGPAIIYDDGIKHWWVDGKRHHLDGPAIELDDSAEQWFINDKQISKFRFPRDVIAFLFNVDHVVASIIESELQKHE